jgi:hypothetical protein
MRPPGTVSVHSLSVPVLVTVTHQEREWSIAAAVLTAITARGVQSAENGSIGAFE